MNDQTISPPHPTKSTPDLMRRLWRDAIRGYIGWLGFAIVLMIVLAAATALTAYMMKPIVDDVFVAKNEALLWPVGMLILGTFFIKGMANYGQAMVMNFVGLKIIADTQNRLFVHLSTMDLAFFHRNATGTLITRFTNDIFQMKVAVSTGLTACGRDFFTLIFLIALMFHQDWQLAFAAFFIFPIAVFPIVRIGRRMRKVTANTQHEVGVFMTALNQTFQGIRMVKAYGLEAYEASKIADAVARILRLNMKAARTQEMARPIMETLGGAAVFVVIIYGGGRVIAEETTAGAFFSFITALLMAYEPLKRLANVNSNMQQGLASAERLYSILDQHAEIKDAPEAVALGRSDGNIRLDDIHFSYVDDRPALRGISLELSAGQTCALVGPSGGGKSTILNLIPRFYDIDKGTISIDGHDVRHVTKQSLFANIALVSQEVTLFDDTVAANIRFGRGGASDEELAVAARNAAAHAFISELPDGYETLVGEQGIKLSGGQRQRLAIARAMIKDAPILLLDEATSALDTESERHVQAALKELMRGRTTLVIAHRLSTVIDADAIYVIDEGRVVEQGKHAELLARGGIYKRLYDLQFADEARNGAEAETLQAAAEAS